MDDDLRRDEELLRAVTEAERRYLSLFLSSRFRERFVGRAEAGVGITEARILWELDARGPTRAGELAGQVEVTPAAITKSLTRLRERGLVEQREDPLDGRARLAALTAAGRRAAALLMDEGDRMTRGILDDWSLDERRDFARLLARFAAGLQAYADGPDAPGPESRQFS
ncbi:MarR family winged helix-turn-helix transcriptional regulator [Demequina maris]|uniref:MarR family winged helix-turn-helix transcriptional regulator n=1 Tax=Demequina maris TaxID=1638982 RepID=UPI000783FF20|nr:MarR family winged helix-turn-helix transcriptional regulator [Demequina maris]